MKVLAAMSGGVDSAVAAARAVDAGHDVTGVHLALSKNPQSYRSGARGCCSREDAHDARRAADVLGIPFYIWDLSDRFAADVVDDFVAEYAAGRTPNPCLRCNEKIKFAAVLDRAVALGFDAVCTGHYARLVRTGAEVQLHRAVDDAKDQSYVLGVLTPDQLRRSFFPLGTSLKSDVRAEAARRGLRWPTSRTATTSASSPAVTPPVSSTPGSVPDRATSWNRGVEGRRARRHPPVHRRPASRLAAGRSRRGRPAPLRPGHLPGDQHGHRRTARCTRRPDHHRHPAHLDRPPAGRRWTGAAQVRAHGEALPASAAVGPDGVEVRLQIPVTGAAPGQAVVLYAGTRVVGSATITATAA